jgi:hypothetical protein
MHLLKEHTKKIASLVFRGFIASCIKVQSYCPNHILHNKMNKIT